MTNTAVGLFAGIGGLEIGLAQHGWSTEMFCELDRGAQAVLRYHFPDVPLVSDVRELRALPARTNLVAAGFPCQDLSQAGRTLGITGARSGLVDHVFRLITRQRGPEWVLLENVPFMLRLDRGQAMRHLTEALEGLGYRWAYRVVDARAFGLPQRRRRVVILASRTEDPRVPLFAQDATEPPRDDPQARACGFYWTEGVRGLGWAVDAVPTLKGGSTIGIASPPAIRLAVDGSIVTPGVVDGERLQGFDAGWTRPALANPTVRPGHRWKLVGNAVSVRMSSWVAGQIAHQTSAPPEVGSPLASASPWPDAAWGDRGRVHEVAVSPWPIREPYSHLEEFLTEPVPLSPRATAGFLKRARSSSLRFADGFLNDVEEHLLAMGGDPRAAA